MNHKIIYNDTHLMTVKTSGKMNADDFIVMAKEILQHPRWAPNNNVLFDHKALDFSGVPVDDLQKIRSFHIENEERIGNGRSAVLVKPGLCGTWNKLWSQGVKIKTKGKEQVFERYDEALNWLGRSGKRT